METGTLYEDPYVRLTKAGLEIKWYYFPSAASRHVDLATIRQVNYAAQGLSLATKGWGMAFSNVWWACDLSRSVPWRRSSRTNVTVHCGESRDKGFSVADWEAFFDALRPLLPLDVQLNAFLPYGLSKPSQPPPPPQLPPDNSDAFDTEVKQPIE